MAVVPAPRPPTDDAPTVAEELAPYFAAAGSAEHVRSCPHPLCRWIAGAMARAARFREILAAERTDREQP